MQNTILKITLSSLIVGGILHAKPVTEEEAKNVALNWTYKKIGKSLNIKKVVNDNTLLKKCNFL